MADIYDQHRAAFAKASAFVILKDGERVATIAFKFGAAVTAYAHWFGLEMTRGTAGGGGYDRQSAACLGAARKIKVTPGCEDWRRKSELEALARGGQAFVDALNEGERGAGWERALRDAGFTVLQAV